MKTKLLLIIPLAIWAGVITANPLSITNKKAKPVKARAIVRPKIYFVMQQSQMHEFKGGVATPLQANIWLSNQTIITPLGAVLSNTGNRVWLVNGDKIDGHGIITSERCGELTNAQPVNGGTCTIQ